MFFRNLNVYVACLMVSGVTLAVYIGALVSFALMPVIDFNQSTGMQRYLGLGVLAAILTFYWWKGRLSPANIKHNCKFRFVFGHYLIGFTNLIAVAALVMPSLLAYITKNPELELYIWLVLPVFMYGFLAWSVGLFMVWSSSA